MRLVPLFVASLAFSAMVLLVVGCVDPPIDLRIRPTVQDETLVTGKPCLPPCWYGILPEETSTEDALDIVNRLPFVNPKSVEETTRDLYENTDDSILWYYSGTSDFGGDLSIRDGNVVWWRVSYPRFLKLADIVAMIGEPDWVWVGVVGGAGTEHIFRFFSKDSGLLLESRLYGAGTRENGRALLITEIEINEARYFQPQSLELYMKNILGATEDEAVQIKKAYQPWPGFGQYIEMRKMY